MLADFKRVSIVRALALLTRVLNVWFRAVIEFTYRYAIHEKIAAHVEFTRQAVNFSVQFCLKLVCTPQQRVMRAC